MLVCKDVCGVLSCVSLDELYANQSMAIIIDTILILSRWKKPSIVQERSIRASVWRCYIMLCWLGRAVHQSMFVSAFRCYSYLVLMTTIIDTILISSHWKKAEHCTGEIRASVWRRVILCCVGWDEHYANQCSCLHSDITAIRHWWQLLLTPFWAWGALKSRALHRRNYTC